MQQVFNEGNSVQTTIWNLAANTNLTQEVTRHEKLFICYNNFSPRQRRVIEKAKNNDDIANIKKDFKLLRHEQENETVCTCASSVHWWDFLCKIWSWCPSQVSCSLNMWKSTNGDWAMNSSQHPNKECLWTHRVYLHDCTWAGCTPTSTEEHADYGPSAEKLILFTLFVKSKQKFVNHWLTAGELLNPLFCFCEFCSQLLFSFTDFVRTMGYTFNVYKWVSIHIMWVNMPS